ncbi:MAG: hypothetical protein ACREOZ_03555, partial [Gloeomargaritales cyanobacterium]
MSSRNIGAAVSQFRYVIENAGQKNFEPSRGQVASMYTGNLMWVREDIPSNFGIFFAASQTTMDSSESFSTLELKAAERKGLSEDDIKQATKMERVVPDNYNDLLQQVQNFHFTVQFLFGSNALVTIQVGTWVTHIFNNKVLFTSTQAHKSDFYASVCFAIDRGVQSYLNLCMIAKERNMVDDSCINFITMQDSINRRTFTFILPPSMIPRESTIGGSDNTTDKKKRAYPSPGNFNDNPGKRLQNNQRVSKWIMKPGETYKLFNDRADQCPKIGEKSICMRYHIKG